VRRSVLLALAALALVVPAGAASAKAPSTAVCRNKIINEWEGTGKIKTTYPASCYHAALKYVNARADLSTYSSLADDIRLALQAALERKKGDSNVPTLVGKHYNSQNSSTGSSTTTSGPGTGTTTHRKTTTTSPRITKPPAQGPDGGQAVSSTSDSSSGTPLPILVLGGIAIALIAAGAIGTGVRYYRRR